MLCKLCMDMLSTTSDFMFNQTSPTSATGQVELNHIERLRDFEKFMINERARLENFGTNKPPEDLRDNLKDAYELERKLSETYNDPEKFKKTCKEIVNYINGLLEDIDLAYSEFLKAYEGLPSNNGILSDESINEAEANDDWANTIGNNLKNLEKILEPSSETEPA